MTKRPYVYRPQLLTKFTTQERKELFLQRVKEAGFPKPANLADAMIDGDAIIINKFELDNLRMIKEAYEKLKEQP